MTPKIIKIEAVGTQDTGLFNGQITFLSSNNQYSFHLQDPFLVMSGNDNQELADFKAIQLNWYFENHISFPYIDQEKAKRAASDITSYGETLFNQVFKDPLALQELRNLVYQTDPIRLEIDSKDSRFQGFHWEALKDPQEEKAYCLRGTRFHINRTSGTPVPGMKVKPSSCLNVLMVTARPGGKNDVGYRTITRPVVDTIEKNRMHVKIHLLRPPTLKQLKEHLQSKQGFYHIVHFDVHGSVLSYNEYLKSMEKASKETGKPAGKQGREEVKKYDGTMPFLDLVSEEGNDHLVPAKTIAELLREAHVPACFLNACQSAKHSESLKESEPLYKGVPTPPEIFGNDNDINNQKLSDNNKSNQKLWDNNKSNQKLSEGPGNPFTKGFLGPGSSLAMMFMERGVRLVVGMAWSVTVEAAKVFVPKLYDALTRGEEFFAAIVAARVALYDSPCRFQGIGCRLELEDWLLPVVWGKGEVPFTLERAYPEDIDKYVNLDLEIKTELESVKTVGSYGFMGRDVDILAVETMLHRRNILLVKGMGGTGKTTLLGHMAQWWIRTGWIDHVVYFGYDRKPYYAEEILNAIGERVMPKHMYGQVLGEPKVEAKAMMVGDYLKEGKDTPRVLAILDNMESITGTEQAVGHKLDKGGREKLKEALKILSKSSIKILLGSRGDEEWLAGETFQKQVYGLEGLDKEARNSLAEAILTGTGVDASKAAKGGDGGEESGAFQRLMEILAGYPLAMEIILPHLKSRSAGELIALLSGAGVDFTGGAISEAVYRCTHVSYSLLSDGAKRGILVLAPFTAFLNMMGKGKEVYLKELRAVESPFFASLSDKHLEEALAEAEKQGLIKQMAPDCYSLQPVFPFFLGLKVEEELDEGQQSGLDRAFCRYMALLANDYFNLMESKNPQERQVGFVLFERDRENLYKAMHRVLDLQGDFFLLYNAFGYYYFNKPLPEEAIRFMEGILKKLERYEDQTGDFLARYGTVVGNLATQYMNMKDFKAAREKFEMAIDLLQKAGRKKETAVGYHQLGYVAQEERDFAEAKRCYGEALNILQEFNDRYNQAKMYHQLGMVAEEERDFAEAKQCYGEALAINQEFNDRYSQAVTYHQLGMVAQEERDFAEAKRCYGDALKIKKEFNDRYSQASTYHQLGRVAEEERDFGEAKRCYGESLKICLEFNDRFNQAKMYHQLGRVAEVERDFPEAKRCYRESLNILQEFNDRYNQAKMYHQLGLLAIAEIQYPQALAYLVIALEIFAQYQDQYNKENVINNLAILFKTWAEAESETAILAAIEKLECAAEVKGFIKKILHESKNGEGGMIGG